MAKAHGLLPCKHTDVRRVGVWVLSRSPPQPSFGVLLLRVLISYSAPPPILLLGSFPTTTAHHDHPPPPTTFPDHHPVSSAHTTVLRCLILSAPPTVSAPVVPRINPSSARSPLSSSCSWPHLPPFPLVLDTPSSVADVPLLPTASRTSTHSPREARPTQPAILATTLSPLSHYVRPFLSTIFATPVPSLHAHAEPLPCSPVAPLSAPPFSRTAFFSPTRFLPMTMSCVSLFSRAMS